MWKCRWEDFERLAQLTKKDQDSQMAILRSCLSDETLKVVLNLSLDEEKKNVTKEVIAALQEYANGQINTVIERRNFNQRTQKSGESFDDFFTDLKSLVQTCNFCDNCQNSLIRDRIVVGLQDADIIERLLVEKDLSLLKAADICRAEEAAKRHRTDITGDSVAGACAMSRYKHDKSDKKGKKHGQGKNPKHKGNKSNETGNNYSCQDCTRQHSAKAKCPATKSVCAACGKVGHWAKSKHHTDKAVPPTNTSGIGLILASVTSKSAPQVDVIVAGRVANGAQVKATPDSGAERTACGLKTLQQLGIDPDNLRDPSITLKAADDHEITQLGEFDVTFRCGNYSVNDTVHVVPNTKDMLLSWYTARDLGFLPKNYPAQQLNRAAPDCHVSQTSAAPMAQPNADTVTAQDLIDEFPTVFDGVIRTMPGEEFHIQLEEDALPFCVKTPRTIPYAYRDKLKSELDKMVANGVIVPVTEPTPWCAPIVVAPKKDSDDIRLCVDLSKLNKFVKRERYQSPTPHEAVADIASSQARVFTKLDALSGYHQCPLAKESQPLTTFITPFGRFMFCRAPFGICSISEHYNRRMDEALASIPRMRKIVDDCLVYDDHMSSHVQHVRDILRRCEEKGISLKREKFIFAKPEVDFCGYKISANGYKIDPRITKAITDFPKPANITDLRSFFGLANQLANFTDDIASKMEPLRELLKPRNEFYWDSVHDKAFAETKETLANTPILAYYDPKRQTSLHVDASRLHGLGFVLNQLQDDGSWRMVQAGSRFITETESRYAMIEIELLGIAWAVKKCRTFLQGLPHFEIVTDARPLVPILNKYQINEIDNPRLQRLRMQLANYKFTATWKCGKDHVAPDALSRSPVNDPDPEDELAEQEVTFHLQRMLNVTQQEAEEDINLSEIRKAAERDDEYQQLRQCIVNGFPNEKHQLPVCVRPYWSVRERLTIDNGYILCGCRLVIPRPMRKSVLLTLHDSHQGIERTKRRARLVVYWPGVDREIENTVRACASCTENHPSLPKETMRSHAEPERIFQHMASDLFSHGGRNFLVITDIKSGWPSTYNLGRQIGAKDIVNALRQTFTDTAVPTVLYTDGGPQYTANITKEFLQQWGVRHVTSSPHYPQSNSHAEASVKAMKKLVKSCWDTRSRNIHKHKWASGLLQWRNTPRADGLSPAQIVFGHPARDTLPIHKRAFAPEWQKAVKDADSCAQERKYRVEQRYNATARDLPALETGTNVVIQDHSTKRWDKRGVIVQTGEHRDYYIKLPSGRVWRRNRRFLRKQYPIVTPPKDNPPANPAPAPVPRRGSRDRRPPTRLIETV